MPNTENFACSQYQTDGNAPHRCTTKHVGGACWRISSDKVLRFSQSVALNSYATIIFYGCILRSARRIRLTVRSEIPKAASCFRAERLGDCSIDAWTSCTFSGVLTFRGWPLGFLGNADPLPVTFETHRRIVFSIRNGISCVEPEARPKLFLRTPW